MLFRRPSLALITVASVLSISSAAFAYEKTIPRAGVPKPVIAAVADRYPEGQFTHFAKEIEGGKVLYEVVLDQNGTHVEVSVSPEGTIVAEEATIALRDLPAAVQKALAASRYADSKVLRVERVTEAAKPGVATFELIVERSGRKHEIVFDQTGKLARAE